MNNEYKYYSFDDLAPEHQEQIKHLRKSYNTIQDALSDFLFACSDRITPLSVATRNRLDDVRGILWEAYTQALVPRLDPLISVKHRVKEK